MFIIYNIYNRSSIHLASIAQQEVQDGSRTSRRTDYIQYSYLGVSLLPSLRWAGILTIGLDLEHCS